MTSRTQFPVDTTFDTRKHRVVAAMVVAASAYLIAPTPTTAAPVTYTFSDATATFGPGFGTDAITGTFTYDNQTSIEIDVAILLTGPVAPGLYQEPGPTTETLGISADAPPRDD